MSQAKDDEPPTDNRENELFPPNCSILELKSAFATFNYGQEKRFDEMGLMDSHASLFHIICSVIKSCKRSADHDQIQKHSQICQGVPRNDNDIERSSISTKSTQGTPVLIEDRQEDKKVSPIWVGRVVPVLPEDRQEIPILDEYGEMVPVLTEDGQVVPDFVKDEQVIPVLAEDGQVVPASAGDGEVVPILDEDEQVIPVLTEDGQEVPILDDEQVVPVLAKEDGQEVPILGEDEQVISVLAEEDGQEVPILDEDGQVPDLAEDGQVILVLDENRLVVPVLAEDGQVVPVLAGYGQVNHVLAEDEQVIPVLAEDGQVDHILAEDGQVGPVLFKDGQGGPVIVEYRQESLVLVKEGEEGSVLDKRNQEDPTLVKEDSVLARDTHKNKGLCKSIHSKRQLASQRKSVIDRRQLIPSHEQLSPAQMIPYVILINQSIPLPISVIQGLCREKKIMCTVQCFKQRRKKKTLLLQPASEKQRIPKVQTDPDFVTFDSLKNLQWKLYKGIVKRKPKMTVTRKISIFSIDKLKPPCPKASVYILPLIPKNWIIDESLK